MGRSDILGNIYIFVFLVNSESILLLALLNICCLATVVKTVFFCTFWRQKTLVLWQIIVLNLIFVYLFCPKNRKIDSRKTSITQELRNGIAEEWYRLSSVSIVMCILLVFRYMFSVFTTSNVLAIRRTSLLWSSPRSC